MTKRKLFTYLGCLIGLLVGVIVLSYGITSTISDAEGHSYLPFTHFVSNASHQTSSYAIQRLHWQERQNQLAREKHQDRRVSQQIITAQPTHAEQARMHAVIKYLNTNDRKFGIHYFSYDQQHDQVLVMFKSSHPSKQSISYAKWAVKSLDAKGRSLR